MPIGGIVSGFLAVSVIVSGLSVWWAIRKTEEVGQLKAEKAVQQLTIEYKDKSFEKYQESLKELEDKVLKINKDSNDFVTSLFKLNSDHTRLQGDTTKSPAQKAAQLKIDDQALNCILVERSNKAVGGPPQSKPAYCDEEVVKKRILEIEKKQS